MSEPTRYEIAAKHPDGRALLVAYSPRLSRSGLRAAVQQRGEEVGRATGLTGEETCSWATKPRPCVTLGEWWIGFTGRTQRDAKTEGELPYVGDL